MHFSLNLIPLEVRWFFSPPYEIEGNSISLFVAKLGFLFLRLLLCHFQFLLEPRKAIPAFHAKDNFLT